MTTVVVDALIRGLLREERFTQGLDDSEGRMLAEWVVEWAELLGMTAKSPQEAEELLQRLSRRGQAIGRFVQLWTQPQTRGSAAQLAATERFAWPLPTPGLPPGDVLRQILSWEKSLLPCQSVAWPGI